MFGLYIEEEMIIFHHFYENEYRKSAESIAEKLVSDPAEKMDVQEILLNGTGNVRFGTEFINAYFALISREVAKRGKVLVAYPILAPKSTMSITVLNFEFRAVSLEPDRRKLAYEYRSNV